MSTSDIKNRSKKTSIAFAIGTALNLLFILIYYLVDHELRSPYMTWSFVFVALGALIYLANMKIQLHSPWGYNFLNAGLVTLSVGLYYHGIVDMADAGGIYQYVFYGVGTALLLAAVVLEILAYAQRKGAHE